MRKGYTLIELLIVIAIVVVLSVVSMISLVSRRNRSQLTTTTQVMAGLLRQAQNHAATQNTGTTWGVHFSNGTPAFFALYYGGYDTTSTVNYYPLPAWVAYNTSTIAAGSYADITFGQISGAASGSSSIGIYLVSSPAVSSTLSVASSGAVSY